MKEYITIREFRALLAIFADLLEESPQYLAELFEQLCEYYNSKMP